MRRALAVLLALVATPAAAHHEVVMIASTLPLLGGVAAIVSALILAWRGGPGSRRARRPKARIAKT
ncbi:MAG: hypothetical protein MRY75_16755 [Marivita sp.]|uniref:hypothetical protein n=1 Tax=Marivita sp. TaxID=2003365 RepID=UPI0025BFD52C|nr:hypothetical protein [Marivita sp.]MCI5112197.1 hypothetical protein [Marivita sp.]